ncbi:MAG: hypothetical protein BGO59_03340 [Spirosoma sp. 48-14]|nr:MAG: hypothetical protein BGO59_03340 [Spirosoma sp. 48-14]
MFQILFKDFIALLLKLFENFLDVNSIPDHDDISQQIKAPGSDLLFFLLLLTDDPVTSEPKITCMSSAKSGQMRVKREETVLTAL